MTPFKVEDGTGYSDSNSYASVGELRDYYEITPENEALILLPDSALEKYLRRATRLIDSTIILSSTPTNENQALLFPRAALVDSCTKEVYLNNKIPKGLIVATIQIAFYLHSNDGEGSSAELGGEVDNIKRVKVDVIEVEFDLRKGTSGVQDAGFPATAAGLLRCLGDLGALSKWITRKRKIF